MAKTPIGPLVAYATPNDFIDRVDVNVIGQLVRDDQSEASATDLQTDTPTSKALMSATGYFLALALQAEMYDDDDFQALLAHGGPSAEMLKDIICGLAIQRLRWRRVIMEPTTHPLYQAAVAWCEAMQEGTSIFAFAETAAAGLPDVEAYTPQDFYFGLPTLSTNNSRYWGIRSNRRPWPRQG